MFPPFDVQELPPELEDALARIDEAKANYSSLEEEMRKFSYNYIEGMVKGFNPATESFEIKMRPPKDDEVKDRPRVLVAQIAEHLRSALDYMIFQLSVLNKPDLNERGPQFVISDSEEYFERKEKEWPRHLTNEQKSFVKQIQPRSGNHMLGVLAEFTAPSKHRYLLSMRDISGFEIYFGEISQWGDYSDWFVYPLEKECAIFARPKDNRATVLLLGKYDAMLTLRAFVEHISDIVRVSSCFFQGRPLELKIVKAPKENT